MHKVLIVDDDRNTVKLLQTLLELDGFAVAIAARGADVLPAVDAAKPDILLMDHHLADMDGVDVVKQLRALDAHKTLPIVIASGLDVEQEAKAAGANHFLVKPFEPGDLPDLFHRLIAERGTPPAG